MENYWELIKESIRTLKEDINKLSDRYVELNQAVWVKMTELEIRLNSIDKEAKQGIAFRRWLWPLIISLAAILLTIALEIHEHWPW